MTMDTIASISIFKLKWHPKYHCILYVELFEQGSRWRVHFSIENQTLNFPYRMDMLYDSKSEMVQVSWVAFWRLCGFLGQNAILLRRKIKTLPIS